MGRSHDEEIASVPLQMAAACGFVASLGQLLAVGLPGWVENYNNGTIYKTRGLWNECKDYTECRSTVNYNSEDPDRAMWIALWFTQLLGLFLAILATVFAVMSIRNKRERKMLRKLCVSVSLVTGFVILNGLAILVVNLVTLGKELEDLSYCFILAVFAVISSWLCGISGCFHSEKKLAIRREKRKRRRERRAKELADQFYSDTYHHTLDHSLGRSNGHRVFTWRSPFNRQSAYHARNNVHPQNHPHDRGRMDGIYH